MTDSLRTFLAHTLDWREAHAGFDAAVADLPHGLRGQRPDGLPHSVWEQVEHIRIAQRDILDFCVNAKYQERAWPDDYWPARPAPTSARAWTASLDAYHADVEEFKRLVLDPTFDLFAKVPWGTGQTHIREVILTFDHTAYHVGQIVLTRRLLGAWE
ncbi:MAG TPA: DinB family protein [Gemmatimonadaceae bacterium]|jgi:uncharacterized damage-inducible protein DinB|nr:DinB family protein [Gemmatimonadaceae bacterium]